MELEIDAVEALEMLPAEEAEGLLICRWTCWATCDMTIWDTVGR